MDRIFKAAAAVALMTAGAFTQDTTAGKVQVQPSSQRAGVIDVLGTTGKFNTFLSLWEIAGIQDDSVRGGKASFEDLGLRDGVTILAPNDAAFAKMDNGKLSTLMKD